MAGFHFSSINHAMTSENPSDSINLFWNQQMEKNKANASLFLTPNFDPTIGFEYPEFGTFGNSLLNPMLAIQQTMQSFQNGSWMMGSNYAGGFNFPGFGNFGFGSPWGNFQSPWGTQDGQGGAGQGKTAEEKLQYAQYDKMKKILNEYKKVATPDELANINAAMEKTGKIDEKLQALKDVAKKSLDPKLIKESLLSMDPYKTQLIKSGYNVGRNDADAKLLDGIDLAESEIRKSGKVDTLCTQVLSGDDDENIIKIFSYWNDKFNSKDPKGIIRLIAKHLPSKSGTTADPYVNQKKAVDHIANSLIAQVNKVKATLDKDANLTLLDNSSKEVADALVTASNNFNKENLDKLAAKIDDLYARLRLIEAEKIRNNIQKDYKFVNDMTGRDIVNDKLIVSETVKDLKSEGISIPSNRDIVPSGVRDERVVSKLDDKPVDEQIEGLKSEKMLKASKVHKDVYTSNRSGYEPVHYYKKEGEQLVELKDVKSIDTKGVCTLRNGERKKLSEVEKVEVSPTEIETYKNSLDKIHQLKQEGKMDKCSTNLPSWDKAGRTLYWSKGRKADGAHQCFVVLGNELMQINCKYVDKNGKIVMEDGSTKEITQLTEDDCTPVNSSEVLATDEPKPTKQTSSQAAQQTAGSKGNTDNSYKLSKDELELRDKIRTTAQEENGAYDLGYQVADDLIGYTNGKEFTKVKVTLTEINSENVIDFLKGYYANDGGGNGFFLQLGLEQQHFKNKFVVPVIKAFLDAVPTELRASDEFKTAQRIYRKCATRGDEEDFKNFSWGWGWDRIWGIDELDQLDDAIEELLSQMKDNSSNETKTE